MANITAKDVQALRLKTGVGMMESKKALMEADGDMDRAIDILRERGLSAAAKKADRIAAEGVVSAIAIDNVGVIVEVNSETDFVAQNADFLKFVDDIAHTVGTIKPADVDALLAANLHGSSETVEEALRDKILVIGENIKVRRFHITEGVVSTYVHGGGKISVLVRFETDAAVAAKPEFQNVAKDVAMQIAAVTPKYIGRDDVPEDAVTAEKEILTVQAMNEGKPENIAQKMVEGRIRKFFEDVCLLEQPFIKDGDVTVATYLSNAAKELGGDIKIAEFTRYEVGEGLEKREESFADEVAGMMN